MTKNPLSQLLGAYLRSERDILRASSEEIAEGLKVGGSFYRMIEAGSANVHPSRILDLIRTFYNSRIIFSALCKYIVAVHHLDSKLESIVDARGAAEELSEIDFQYRKFFYEIKGLWSLLEKENGKANLKLYITSNKIVSEVKEFLTNEHYGMPASRGLSLKITDLIGDTPSLNFQVILDFIQALKKHPPLHIHPYASEWEESNKHEFTEICGIFENYNVITSKENLSKFDYNYLFRSNFKKTRYIFISPEKDPEKIRTVFMKTLKECLLENPGKYEEELSGFNDAMKKVTFKTVDPKNSLVNELFQHKIYLHGKSFEISVNSIWIFSLRKGNNIGFAAQTSELGDPRSTSMTVRETELRLEQFNSLWASI